MNCENDEHPQLIGTLKLETVFYPIVQKTPIFFACNASMWTAWLSFLLV